jgi:IS5 family transposase
MTSFTSSRLPSVTFARRSSTESTVLGAIPGAAELVHADLARRGEKSIDTRKRREGMTAEQVLRAFVVKQMNGYSYEELAFHFMDSSTYRTFCRFGIFCEERITLTWMMRRVACSPRKKAKMRRDQAS